VPEPSKLTELLDNVQLEWQLQLKDERQFQLQKDPGGLWVNLDGEKFRRVLDNLISNAVKFTQEEGNIMVRLARQYSMVHREASDNGIGKPESIRPHLFEPFSRAGRKRAFGESNLLSLA
jgi:signal transduction histidine kinase